MTLSRQYKTGRVIQTKRLTCMWAIYTMDGQVKYLDRNQYSQVLSIGIYFYEIYPLANRADMGQALKTFVMELGVPEELTVDG